MRMMLFFLFFGLIQACSQAKDATEISLFEADQIKLPQVQIYNGKVKLFQFKVKDDVKKLSAITCENGAVPYQVVDSKTLNVYLSTGYYSKPRSYFCYAKSLEGQGTKFLQVDVTEFAYAQEQLNVSESKVTLSAKDLKRVEKEQKMLNVLYAKRAPQLKFVSPFIVPLDSVRTSIYGNRRVFNNKKFSTHLGNDFRAGIGTPVPVSNDGEVVFVGDLFFSGKTVIIDHGMQFFSMYAHLSSFKVKAGDQVKKSAIIALSGNTGRVSGPHLHWGVKINGEWVDGVSLVEESNKIATP